MLMVVFRERIWGQKWIIAVIIYSFSIQVRAILLVINCSQSEDLPEDEKKISLCHKMIRYLLRIDAVVFNIESDSVCASF